MNKLHTTEAIKDALQLIQSYEQQLVHFTLSNEAQERIQGQIAALKAAIK